MNEQVVLGYTAAIVAVFFFGTCYVPAKTYATYGPSRPASSSTTLFLFWRISNLVSCVAHVT
jgi:hypothetical protein